MHGRLSHLLEVIELEAPVEGYAAVRRLAELLGASIRGHAKIPTHGRRSPHRVTADALERLIERRLDSSALCMELLCAYCGCSRATVYRLTDAQGGPIKYIRQRRLQRAFQELISGQVPHGRMAALALRHRFASEATFNRAFTRTFGMPPGRARALAERSRCAALAGAVLAGDAGHAGVAEADAGTAQVLGWIRALTLFPSRSE